MPHALACTVRTRLQAETLLMRLRAGGILTGAISLLFRGESGTLTLARDRDSHLSAGAARDSLPEGTLGGVLGGLSGVTLLQLPGGGPHVVAGPLRQALQGADGNTVAVTLEQGLVALGVPAGVDLERYPALLAQGHLLLAVTAAEDAAILAVARLLRVAGAEDLCHSVAPAPAVATGATRSCLPP